MPEDSFNFALYGFSELNVHLIFLIIIFMSQSRILKLQNQNYPFQIRSPESSGKVGRVASLFSLRTSGDSPKESKTARVQILTFLYLLVIKTTKFFAINPH